MLAPTLNELLLSLLDCSGSLGLRRSALTQKQYLIRPESLGVFLSPVLTHMVNGCGPSGEQIDIIYLWSVSRGLFQGDLQLSQGALGL